MYDVKNLEKLSAFNKAVPKAMASFQSFDEAALADGAIPKKYKELIAVAVRSYHSVPILHRRA
jgi:alkylhydroperoxidase/carboxymuconolactone decarboxylase family protein YurZ